ncbi:MAG: hypothetical protein F6J90_17635 [Moorea sp. SIOASIH]|nr:hypothetical protein [Moorena sp. SIOASIH]
MKRSPVNRNQLFFVNVNFCYGGLHNYQVHIVSPLPSSLFPLPSSLLPAPCSLQTQNFVPN